MTENYCPTIYLIFKILIFCYAYNSVHCHEAIPGNEQEASIFHTKSNLNKADVITDNRLGIVGAFVFPHGGVILDPETRDYSKESASTDTTKKESLKLNHAMKQAAKELVSTKPDLIIMTSPHGLLIHNHFLILGSSKVEGSFEQGRKYSASFDLDFNSSLILYKQLLNKNNPVEFLTIGVGGDTLPIRWAEILPWIFIKEAAEKANFKLPPVVLVGVPIMDTSILLKFGNDIYATIEKGLSQKRIAIVISCDLSHYHSNALSSPYPLSKNAQPFDNYCVEWAKLDRNRETQENSTIILIRQAGDIVDSVGSCGYYGLVILHGILSDAVKNNQEYRSHFYQYSTPSYFGMMVTSWLPE